MHVVNIDGKVFLEEDLDASGIHEDICILDISGDYAVPDFFQKDMVTTDTLIYFSTPNEGFRDFVRVRMQKEAGLEVAYINYFKVETREGKVVAFEQSDLGYDPLSPKIEDLVLVRTFVDDRISVDPEHRERYKDFCVLNSSQRVLDVEKVEAERPPKSIEGLDIRVQTLKGGTSRVTVKVAEGAPYSVLGVKARLVDAIMAFTGLEELTHRIVEKTSGFILEIPLHISEPQLRRFFPV